MHSNYRQLALLTILLFLVLCTTTAALAQTEVIHTVRPGETLHSIGRLYGVSPSALAAANRLANPNFVFVGQRLVIPHAFTDGEIIHVVARGESLTSIARRYGVDSLRLAAYNGIGDVDLIFIGQRLRIPGMGMVTVAPTAPPVTVIPVVTPQPTPTATRTPLPTPTRPTPTATPPPVTPQLPCLCEAVVIFSPTRGMTITNPVTVTGLASGFEQTAVVAVLDGSGGRIGLAPAMIVGPYGQQGAFTVTVPFAVPANSQPGRIQVWSESPRDGAIEHLSSVTVAIQGLDLDTLLARLDAALRSKDYAALAGLMADPFQIGFYRSQGLVLAPVEAIEQLRQTYLGPGAAQVSFRVDARKVLADRVSLGPDIVHVVYSYGWGKEKNDDAFLLIGNVGGRARWVGMLYVQRSLVDYAVAP